MLISFLIGIENLFVEIARKLLMAQSIIGKSYSGGGNPGGNGRVAPAVPQHNLTNDGASPSPPSGGCCG